MCLERIGELGAWMPEQGASIALHCHMGAVIETASDIDRLMQDTPDSVGLLLDMGHLTFAGEDPAAASRKWARRVNHVHAKDVRPDFSTALKERWSYLVSVVDSVYTVPGDERVDLISVLKPLADIGYDAWVIVEAEQIRRRRIRPRMLRGATPTRRVSGKRVGLGIDPC